MDGTLFATAPPGKQQGQVLFRDDSINLIPLPWEPGYIRCLNRLYHGLVQVNEPEQRRETVRGAFNHRWLKVAHLCDGFSTHPPASNCREETRIGDHPAARVKQHHVFFGNVTVDAYLRCHYELQGYDLRQLAALGCVLLQRFGEDSKEAVLLVAGYCQK